MKIVILNGGPRKKWNTAMMCEHFAEGAGNAGAEVETLRLFDLDYRGCYSCFACKRKDGPSYGRCGYPDAIRELLARTAQADGVVFASPIYFGEITAQLRGFMERLLFPFQSYGRGYPAIAPKRPATAMIYTMNDSEEALRRRYLGTDGLGPLGFLEQWVGRIWSPPERICACDTCQFDDYGKYVADGWDAAAKARRRSEQFPQELAAARDAGSRMAAGIAAQRAGK